MGLIIEYPEVFIAIVCFFLTCYLTRDGIPWNWPLLGMLPSLFVHLHRLHDRCVDLLPQTNYTFLFKGPCWFANMSIFADMDMLLTGDPSNIQYIMTSNFANYPKGDEFAKIFDILGDGIFNSDGDLWKFHRKITQSLLSHRRFMRFLVKVTCDKIEKGLVPILQHAFKDGLVIDLQDVFQRLTFDTTCMVVSGHDPGCLSIEFRDVPVSRALDEVEETIAYRHALPENMWKLQQRLGIGPEKKLSQARKILDHFINNIVLMKREELSKGKPSFKVGDEEEAVDLLTSFLNAEVQDTRSKVNVKDDKFLRDTILNLLMAGRDTTSSALTWFIWLITQHPRVEDRMRAELRGILPAELTHKWHIFKADETNRLTYLHAALCESLRLYPPVPFQHKSPLKPDTLPSGHRVTPKMKIIFSMYAMARMKAIWGEDCYEFKPERWINEQGKLKYEPSYKFLSFNAGPRTCLGKEVAFTQMKMVSSTLIHNYKFQVVNGHKVKPDLSVILHIKHGLKVKVSNRWSVV